jgi:flagellar assembly protein FliH
MTHSSDSQAPGAPRPARGRFIPGEQLGGFSAWAPTALADPNASSNPGLQGATLAQPSPALAKALRAQLVMARQSGYQEGYRDGLAALEGFKQAHSQQLSAQLGDWLESFDAQMLALEARMAQAVADSAVLLAARVLRSELKAHPEHVLEVARQALDALMLGARHVVVQVHPDDLPLVAQGLQELLQARGARLVAQAQVQRGGCLIESDLGQVDARLEARWAQCVEALGASRPLPDEAV